MRKPMARGGGRDPAQNGYHGFQCGSPWQEGKKETPHKMGTTDLHAENHGKKARGRPRTKWVPRIPALHCATTILYYTILNYYTIRLCCTTVHDVLQTLCSIRMTQKQTRMIQTLCSFSGPYYTILHDTLLYCAMLLYCLSVFLSVCLPVCLSVCLSVCLTLSVCLSVCHTSSVDKDRLYNTFILSG